MPHRKPPAHPVSADQARTEQSTESGAASARNKRRRDEMTTNKAPTPDDAASASKVARPVTSEYAKRYDADASLQNADASLQEADACRLVADAEKSSKKQKTTKRSDADTALDLDLEEVAVRRAVAEIEESNEKRKTSKVAKGGENEGGDPSKDKKRTLKSTNEEAVAASALKMDNEEMADISASLEHILYAGSAAKATEVWYRTCVVNKTYHGAGGQHTRSKMQGLYLSAGIGTWPTMPAVADASGAEKEAALTLSDALRSNDSWEERFGDCFINTSTFSDEVLSRRKKPNFEKRKGAPESTTDNDDGVPRSLLSRCWDRAVHAADSLVPRDALNETVQLDESECEQQDRHQINSGGMKEKQRHSLVESILQREVMFAVDAILHMILTGTQSCIDEEDQNGGRAGPLVWTDILKILSTAACGSDVSDGRSEKSSSSHLLRAIINTVNIHPSIPSIPLNENVVKNVSIRLAEMYGTLP